MGKVISISLRAASVPCAISAEARARGAAAAGDEELMSGFCSSPREETFEELARRHSAAVFRVAQAMLKAREDAEDAVQECFLRVIRSRASYRPETCFSPWLFAILRNICHDKLRRRHREPRRQRELSEPAWEADPRAQLEAGEDLRAAHRAFLRLPQSEREVLTLHIHGGLKFSEIAAVCGISMEAAKKRAYRGLDRLRRELAGRD